MVRLFKPGNWVRLKSGGPLMEVVKYVENKHPFVGTNVSNARVLCVWYDQEKGRCEGVFHQNSLQKERLFQSDTSKTYSHSALR